MTTYNSRLLTPPQQEEEVYPYRRAWRSVVVENAIFFVVVVLLLILVNSLGISFDKRLYRIMTVGLALLPIGLWLYFSWWQERFVPQPRQRLMAVAIVAGLAANAVGIPLVNDFLQVDRWLPMSSAVNRIVGYTFTVGIVQEFLKYLVLRYTVWPYCIRVRLDGVAYGAAAGLGYASVLNLAFVLSEVRAPDAAAPHIFANLTLHLVTGILIGYGLSELRLGSSSASLPVVTLALASFLTGVSIPVRAGLVNAAFSFDASAPRQLLGLLFSVTIFVVGTWTLSFFYNSAERQSQEAAASDDQ